jgi:hypothetical protein
LQGVQIWELIIMTNFTLEEETQRDYAREQRDHRGPAWCWELAGEWIGHRAGPSLQRFGADFLDVLHYRTLCAHSDVARRQAINVHAAIAAAEELNADTIKTGHLKIAVLGELDPKVMCQQLNLAEEVFRAWEKTFLR